MRTLTTSEYSFVHGGGVGMSLLFPEVPSLFMSMSSEALIQAAPLAAAAFGGLNGLQLALIGGTSLAAGATLAMTGAGLGAYCAIQRISI